MRSKLFLLAITGLGLAACTTILGSFELDVPSIDGGIASDATLPTADGGAGTDSAQEDAPLTQTDSGADAGVVDAAPDAPPVVPCQTEGDGGVLVYPGDPCLFDQSGKPVPSLGACKPGTWACVDLGGGQRKASCFGAIAPQAETCTADGGAPSDENCNGSVDEGCVCTLGAQRPCGVGACSVGAVQTCVTQDGGVPGWGPCVGPAPKPRDCGSTVDNDCNGKSDREEAFCKCTGPKGQPELLGNAFKCEAFGSLNQCAGEKITCVLSGDSSRAQWDIRCPSGNLDCGSKDDNDCQNGPDGKERQCTLCKDPNGDAVLPRQTFTAEMVGCGGAVEAKSSSSLCGNGCTVASATEWTQNSGKLVPNAHYWTSDDGLRLFQTKNLLLPPCLVDAKGVVKHLSYTECQSDTPARVCSELSVKDDYGNVCTPTCKGARYMGGCGNGTNDTAGAICLCP